MNAAYYSALDVCKRHAGRLIWAMTRLQARFPLSASTMLFAANYLNSGA